MVKDFINDLDNKESGTNQVIFIEIEVKDENEISFISKTSINMNMHTQ